MSNQASLGDISNSGKSNSRKGSSETKIDQDSEGRKKRRFGPLLMEIPESWRDERLKDVTELITRGKQPTYADDGIPVINQECIYWSGWHWENLRYLDKEVGDNWKDKRFPNKGDVIINSTGQGTLGRALVYPDNKERAIDSHVTLVRTDEEVQPNFFRYFLESKLGNGLLYSMCVNGSTGQIELSKSKLNLLSLPVPPKDEQRRIASVLYNVDQAIQKTEEIIEQTQRVKKGLMQDLFTEGYYSHETKKVHPIGEMPEDWNYERLDDVLDEPILNGYSPNSPGEETGKKVLKVSALSLDGFQEDEYKSAPADDPKVDQRMLEEGDILISRSNTRERVALASMYKGKPENCSYPDLMMRLRPDESKMDRKFFLRWIQYPRFRAILGSRARGTSTSMAKINQGMLSDMIVPVPPMDEQQKIAEVIDEIYRRRKAFKEEKEQLQRLKKGLMQDLLTGSVRTDEDVRVLDEVVEVEG